MACKHARSTRLLGLVLGLGLGLASAGTLRAEPSVTDHHAAARALLAEAEDAFVRDSDCARALPLFEGALRLEPSWIALSGVAACHDQSGRLDLAYRAYARLLRDFGAELPGSRTQVVRARLDELEQQLGGLELHVTPAGAQVSIDGEVAADGTAGILRLLPGAHRVVLSATGHAQRALDVQLSAGRVERLAVALLVEIVPRPRVRSPWIWRGLAISSGVLLAGGAGLFVLAERDRDAFDAEVAEQQGDDDHPVEVSRARAERAERERTGGFVLVGAGVAAAASALAVAVWPSAPVRIDVRAPAAGGVTVGASWSF